MSLLGMLLWLWLWGKFGSVCVAVGGGVRSRTSPQAQARVGVQQKGNLQLIQLLFQLLGNIQLSESNLHAYGYQACSVTGNVSYSSTKVIISPQVTVDGASFPYSPTVFGAG